MPRVRRKGIRRLDALDFDQLGDLLWGPDTRQSYFESPLARRAAYFGHREMVLGHVHAGQRPWAFYEYELREHPPEISNQAPFLRGKGLLEPWEEAQLQAWESIRKESK
jgi:hypothetical protein